MNNTNKNPPSYESGFCLVHLNRLAKKKTVNYCFFKRCPIKQGAEGARVSSDAQRLCGSDVRTHVSNVGLECGGSHKRKTTPFGVASFMVHLQGFEPGTH